MQKTEKLLNNQQEYGHVEPKEEPNADYEKLRRRIGNNVQELWSFVRSELLRLQKQATNVAPEVLPSISYILSLGAEHKR